jgi:hypothetical protein
MAFLRASRSGVRLGKTTKWAVAAAVLLTTAIVISVVAAFGHVGDQANKELDRNDAIARRTAAAFPQIKLGTSMAHVRRRLGRPIYSGTDILMGIRERCWNYGGLTATYEFCFRRGKLYSKSQL